MGMVFRTNSTIINNKGKNNMPPHTPSPEEVHHISFITKWWMEFLGMITLGMIGLYFKAQRKITTETLDQRVVPIGDKELNNRLLICKQSILLSMREELNNRDKELFRHVDRKNKELLQHIKDIIGDS